MDSNTLTPRKHFILRLAGALAVVLLACTLISSSVYRILLPVVEVCTTGNTPITFQAETIGTLEYGQTTLIRAAGSWQISSLEYTPGESVSAGQPLLRVDTSNYNIETERLQLAILQAQNQLVPVEMNASDRRALELQLKIAQGELEEYRNGTEVDAQKLQLELDVLNAQNTIAEESAEAQAAIDALAQYRAKGADFNYAEAKKIRSRILQLSTKLRGTGLTDEKRAELTMELEEKQAELASLLEPYDGYDPVQEQQLRVEALRAQNKVTASGNGKSILEMQLAIAEQKLELYTTDDPYQEERLQLTVDQLQAQLNGDSGSSGKQKSLELQSAIAREELVKYKKQYPADGIVTAAADGTLMQWRVEPGDTVAEGQILGDIAPAESLVQARWQLSPEAARGYSVGAEVSLTVITSGNKKFQYNVTVSERKWDIKSEMWDYFAELSEYKQAISDVMQVKVVLNRNEKSPGQTLPLSCVQKDPLTEENYIYRLQRREGLFSEEYYAERVAATIVTQNSMYASVKAILEPNDKIIRYTTKEIREGAVVALAE